MKLSVVALDYDGTIAVRGVLQPAARTAITRLREQGIMVVLVSGRILNELRTVAGDLRFVDAIVAENGAVLAFPATGYVQALAGPPPVPFLDELRRRGVLAKHGRVIVEADTTCASTILDVIQEQQLPLAMLFNRDRVMMLPQALSKATGLRELLRMVRRSEHDAIGIGDAENDHALLEVCEIGAAAAWGSPALQAVADEIVEGTGPADTARYLARLAATPLLEPSRTGRHRIALGYADNGALVTVPSGADNVLIAGDAHSGTSWLAGLLAEQLILQRYCLGIVDPHGDHGSLASLPGVTILGSDAAIPAPHDVERALRYPDGSAVIDLSGAPASEQAGLFASDISALTTLRRDTGLPHRLLIDGADMILHDPSVLAQVDLDRCGHVLVTHHLAAVHPDALASCGVILATRTTAPRDIAALARLTDGTVTPASLATQLETLALGEAVLVQRPADAPASSQRVQLLARLSAPVHRQP